MSNEIMKKENNEITNSGFATPADMQWLNEAMSEDCAGIELQLDRIKIPAGGSTAFEIPTGDSDEPEMVKEITGVILFKSNEFVSKEEFYKLCRISKKTAYKLIKSGRVKAIKRKCASRHCYEIPISEIERLESVRYYLNKLREEEIDKVKEYYSEKLQSFPNVIISEDVQAITGYAKETVRKWIQSGKLVGMVYKSKYVIAQKDFLDFVISSHFVGITRKSREHLADFIKLGIVDEGGQRL